MSMNVRDLMKDDALSYMKLRQFAVRTTPRTFLMTPAEEDSFTLENYENMLVKSYFCGAFSAGKLVGFLGLGIKPYPCDYIGKLISFFVLPEFRGQGLGSKMLIDREAFARRRGLRQLTLAVVTSNTAAIKLYEHNGYRLYGTEPDALRHGDEYLSEELRFKLL